MNMLFVGDITGSAGLEKARQELGYTSRPFRETIRDEVQWLREGGYLKESE